MRVVLLVLAVSAVLLAHPVDDLYQLYHEGRGKDWDVYNNSLNYVYLVKNSSDPLVRALSWMNLLYYGRALKELEGVKGADFYRTRMKVLRKKDKRAAEDYLRGLPKSLAGRAEKAFVRGYVFGEDVTDELGRIYEEAVKEYEKERIDYVDMFAFDYAYFLRKEDPWKAMVVLSQVVQYDFTLESTEVYYSVDNLKMSYYPVLLLLSRVMYDLACAEIERIFGMKVDEFKRLPREDRERMIAEALMDEDKSKTIRYINYLLKYSVNVLAYGVNDYYFLSRLKDVPDLGIIDGSFGEFQDEVRALRMMVMVSMGREWDEKADSSDPRRFLDDLWTEVPHLQRDF